MPRYVVWLLPIGALAASATLVLTAADRHAGRPVASAYTVLNKAGTQLREAFNEAKGSVRLLFVVDPICPGCLRGLDDVDKALLSKTNDPQLQTFVVNVSVLGGKARDVGPATKLLHNSYVHEYWNSSGAFGWQLAEAVGLKHNGKLAYAWDVWLLYGPDASWDGQLPPRPLIMMTQLYAFEHSVKFPPLDRDAFARHARQLLKGLSPTASVH